jgi:hypothetical protein
MTRLRIFLSRLRGVGRSGRGIATSTTRSAAIWPKRQRSTSGRVFPRKRRVAPRSVVSVV